MAKELMFPYSNTSPVEADSERCAECGELRPKAQLIAFSDIYVCAQCKPTAVAKITRGQPVGNVWRAGKLLVVARKGSIPLRCVLCNQPAPDHFVNRVYFWRTPIRLGDIATSIPLCSTHNRHRLNRIAICVGIVIATSLFPIYVTSSTGLYLFTFALLVSVFGTFFASRLLPAARRTRTHAFIRSAGEAFLANLPKWPKT
jgi:hypothetical protein